MIDKEFQYYLQHQNELVARYNNRYLVIHEQQVVGDYDTFAEAVTEAQKRIQPGTFIVQRCSEGPKDYTFSYHSRVRIHNAAVQSVHG